jgi:hypothetical protein
MSKLKLLFFLNIPSPYRVDFLNELSRHYNITAIFERLNVKTREEEWLSNNFSNEITLKKVAGINLLKEHILSVSLIRYLFNQEFEFIFLGGYFSPSIMILMLLSGLSRKRIVIILDGVSYHGRFRKIKRYIKIFLMSNKRIIYLSPSKNTDNYLIDLNVNLAQISRYKFTSVSEKNKISIDNLSFRLNNLYKRRLKVLLVARPLLSKGILEFYLTAASFSDADFVYVGGTESEFYSLISKPKKLENLTFMGFLNNKQLINVYDQCDIFAFPTHNDYWGMVVIEAMSRGLIVFSSNRSEAACEIVINGYNGYTTNLEYYVADFLSFLYKLKNNSNEIQRLSNNSIYSIKDFTIEQMVQDHINFVNENLE